MFHPVPREANTLYCLDIDIKDTATDLDPPDIITLVFDRPIVGDTNQIDGMLVIKITSIGAGSV